MRVRESFDLNLQHGVYIYIFSPSTFFAFLVSAPVSKSYLELDGMSGGGGGGGGFFSFLSLLVLRRVGDESVERIYVSGVKELLERRKLPFD